MDIDQFVIELPRGPHRLKPDGIHSGVANWKRRWATFFEQHRTPTRTDIMNQLVRMRRDFDLE